MSKDPIQQMQKLARQRGGKCLSKKYIAARFKLTWQCVKGHNWEAIYPNIVKGAWCPRCAGNKKLSIEAMNTLAKTKKGKCISINYSGVQTKLRWQCAKGHIWDAIPNSVKRGTWCPICAGRHQTIDDMKEIAQTQSGKCLSERYITATTKLKWQCAKGHTWEAIPSSVKRGTWCPKCRGGVRKTIQEMYLLAQAHSGKCLSTKYNNAFTKLKWQCRKGHMWDSNPAIILRGSWCPICAGHTKLTINDMHKLAYAKGGRCLSKRYYNTGSKLRWQCAQGHIWRATPAHIKNGTYCPYCAGKTRYTIQNMRKFARQQGGKCLSKDYLGINRKLLWQCSIGHQWETKPSGISSRSWCPECTISRRERLCRAYFETIFGEKFPNCYPGSWLVNQAGKKIQLDGYCEKLGIAFEYQGEQHYREVKLFHRKKTLDMQKQVDALKQELCRRKEITLIEVPFYISDKNMGSYILKQLQKNKLKIPHKTLPMLNTLLSKVCSPHKLQEMKDLAKENGGWCLSKSYIGALTKLIWKCKAGHLWEAIPSSVKRRTWCSVCAYRKNGLKKRLTIGEMQGLAAKRKWNCLSTSYLGNHHALIWKCERGHIWEAPASRIKSGAGCPECAGRRQTIDDMQKVAKAKGGKCLSERYITAKTKLTWQCASGHIWQVTPDGVKHDHWCPICARERHIPWNKGQNTKTNSMLAAQGRKHSQVMKEKYAKGELTPHNKKDESIKSTIGDCYVNKQMTCRQIADMLHIAESTVRNYLKLLGIKTRNQKEAAALKYAKGYTVWNKDKKMNKEPWNKGKKGLQLAWNKGKKMSLEHRKKLSEIRKKLFQNPEFKQRASDIQKMNWCRPEQREKMSKIKKQQLKEHPEIVEKQRIALLKYYQENPEVKTRIKESVKVQWQSPEYRKKQTQSHQN